MSYRFRTGEKGELVLQVGEREENRYAYGGGIVKWRDAGVADIPVTDPFRVEQAADTVTCGTDPEWLR